MKIEETVIYEDIYYQVKYSWDDDKGNFAGLDFIANQVISFDEVNGILVAKEIEEIKCLDGHVKWDGCMNVLLEKGYAHFCGRQQMKQYAQLFEMIYDMALSVGCED